MNDIIDIKNLRKASSQIEQSPKKKEKSFHDFLNTDIQIRPALSDRFKEGFYTELGTLLQAGVDVHSALDLIKDEYKKSQKLAIEVVLKKVVSGTSLSDAFKSTKGFTPYEYHSTHIGEETGELGKVLSELALFFSKRIKQRRQVIGALTYPMVVLGVAVGAISFMLAYVVPMFSEIFKKSGDDLPPVTRFVIAASTVIKNYGDLFTLVITAIASILFFQRHKAWFRQYSSAIVLRIPLWGKLIQKIYVARFASTMSMLLGAHIPMLQAIGLVREIIRFYPFEKALIDAEGKIMSGQNLYQALGEYSIFPSKMIVMIRVGEEVNELEEFFKKLSDQYSAEVEYQMSVLAKFIEPLIIIFLGCVVGLVLIAMYLPLFKLGQQF